MLVTHLDVLIKDGVEKTWLYEMTARSKAMVWFFMDIKDCFVKVPFKWHVFQRDF